MRWFRHISPLVLLAVCLWLPAASNAGYDQAFLTITPSVDTPPFTWDHSDATATPPAEQESLPPTDPPALPDSDESSQNAWVNRASPIAAGHPPDKTDAWGAYLDRFIIPPLQAALATRLTQSLPLPAFPQRGPSTAVEDDDGQPLDAQADSPEPFIEIIIPLASASPDPPIAMHVQLLVPQETILLILRDATGTASISENAPAHSPSSDHIQRTRAFQTYLDTMAETLKNEAAVQQHFRTASLTSSLLSVAATFSEIIALGTLPLHAVFTTIPMLVYYVVTTALGDDPLALQWKLFSSTSNSLLHTTFSETLIPVP